MEHTMTKATNKNVESGKLFRTLLKQKHKACYLSGELTNQVKISISKILSNSNNYNSHEYCLIYPEHELLKTIYTQVFNKYVNINTEIRESI